MLFRSPGKPLAQYTLEDVRREYNTKKDCAPMCTVSCVHQISYFDFWRDPQTLTSKVTEEHHSGSPLVKISKAGE